jgi:hypothetical protein
MMVVSVGLFVDAHADDRKATASSWLISAKPDLAKIQMNEAARSTPSESAKLLVRVHEEEAKWYRKPDWWVAVFTGGLFVATCGLWLFTGLLWRATLKAVRDTEASIELSRRATLAAEGANFAERAWIVLDQLDWINSTNTIIDGVAHKQAMGFSFRLVNVGRSPALNTSVFSAFAFFTEGEELPHFDAPVSQESSNVVLGQGKTFNSPYRGFPRAKIDSLVGGRRLAIYCRVNYVDIFTGDVQRCTELTLVVRKDGQRLDDEGKLVVPNLAQEFRGSQNGCT